ncbi:hypothetical protein IG631_15833 [Alternaria alternata]|nr:hypothetical protein IG631_15833 [Alternaria alternata]
MAAFVKGRSELRGSSANHSAPLPKSGRSPTHNKRQIIERQIKAFHADRSEAWRVYCLRRKIYGTLPTARPSSDLHSRHTQTHSHCF